MKQLVAVFAGLGLIVAALAGLALAFVLTLAAAGAMAIARLTGRLKPAVGSRTASERTRGSQTREYRVWNDGRGTIIDM